MDQCWRSNTQRALSRPLCCPSTVRGNYCNSDFSMPCVGRAFSLISTQRIRVATLTDGLPLLYRPFLQARPTLSRHSFRSWEALRWLYACCRARPGGTIHIAVTRWMETSERLFHLQPQPAGRGYQARRLVSVFERTDSFLRINRGLLGVNASIRRRCPHVSIELPLSTHLRMHSLPSSPNIAHHSEESLCQKGQLLPRPVI